MRLDEFENDFSFFDTWEERYVYLIELGRKMPLFPEEYKIAENHVQGCLSTVFCVLAYREGKIQFLADSDAAIVKGVLAIFYIILEGISLKEAKDINFETLIERLGLNKNLTQGRRNGLFHIIQRIKKYLENF